MRADLLHWVGQTTGDDDDVTAGPWLSNSDATYQDPISGEVLNDWEAVEDNPSTPSVDENIKFGQFDCIARGIVDGGIRVAGTTERFGDTYENIDFVKMWTPSFVVINKRDRITNIRIRNGAVIWKDEEYNSRPTIFNVNGVTPLFDAWNRHVENFVLLERAPGGVVSA